MKRITIIFLLLASSVFTSFACAATEQVVNNSPQMDASAVMNYSYTDNATYEASQQKRELLNATNHASPFSPAQNTELGTTYGPMTQAISYLDGMTVAQINRNMENRKIKNKPGILYLNNYPDDGDTSRFIKVLSSPPSKEEESFLLGIIGIKASNKDDDEDNFDFDSMVKALYVAENEFHPKSVYITSKMRPITIGSGIGFSGNSVGSSTLGAGDSIIGGLAAAVFGDKKTSFKSDKYDTYLFAFGYEDSIPVEKKQSSEALKIGDREFIGPYFFSTDSSLVEEKYKNQSLKYATMINNDWDNLIQSGHIVFIDGYCDKRASDGHNALLGLHRSISVASELATILVNDFGHSAQTVKKMLNPRSAGEYHPFYNSDDLNRRVDIYYASPKTRPPKSAKEMPKITSKGAKK